VAFAGDNTAIWRGRSSTEGDITMPSYAAAIDGVFGLDTKVRGSIKMRILQLSQDHDMNSES
jgi:hypothetical protein